MCMSTSRKLSKAQLDRSTFTSEEQRKPPPKC